MGFGLVGDLVAHAGLEQKLPTVFEFSIELALEAKQDVALGAPMVGQVPRRIFHHPHANVSELLGAPIRGSSDAFVFGGLDG